MTIAIIVGMTSEGRLAIPLGHPIAIGGGTTAGATQAAQNLIAQGATALISFGLAAGLDPSLPPGTLINPTHIIDGHIRYPTAHTLIPWAPPPARTIAGTSTILSTTAQKLALFQLTGAAAADMESYAIAQAATAAKIPFAVLRAIADPATTTLPHAALNALDPDGTPNLPRILRSLARNPTQLPALLTLALHAAQATRALKTVIASAPKTR